MDSFLKYREIFYSDENTIPETKFDIVIPVGPNDIDLTSKVIDCIKHNIFEHRNIYVISYDPNISLSNCIIINENIFPFNIKTLGEYTNHSPRTGWYLQQLLKLYAGFYIPGILSNYLVIDSDTFFINPTYFFEDGLPLYNIGKQFHKPYFDHMEKLHPSLKKQNDFSGICHHMLFQRNIILDLFELVEKYTGDVFWRSFMKYLDPENINAAGASEYEIYFNFLLIYHSDKMKIRELKWLDVFQLCYHPELNYISWHHYKR